MKAKGSSVYVVSHGKTSPFEFAREATDVLGKVASKYDIAHCHVPNNAFVTLRACRRAGVGVRVIHSHLNSSSDNAIHRLRNAPLIAFGKRFANAYSACSNEAGKYLFGNVPFELINNGICLDDFAYSINARENLRADLGISENAPVIGCVGRFVKQKNYSFAIDAFATYVKVVPEARLVILGDGEGRRALEDKIASLGLSDKVFLPVFVAMSLAFIRFLTCSLCLPYMKDCPFLLSRPVRLACRACFRRMFPPKAMLLGMAGLSIWNLHWKTGPRNYLPLSKTGATHSLEKGWLRPAIPQRQMQKN